MNQEEKEDITVIQNLIKSEPRRCPYCQNGVEYLENKKDFWCRSCNLTETSADKRVSNIFKNNLPNKVTRDNYLYANSDCDNSFLPNKYSGKYCIKLDMSKMDSCWKKIALATQEGKLGPKSISSTRCVNPRFVEESNQNLGVIMVFTNDFKNKVDLKRIRDYLKFLGFKDPIPYKTDEATRKRIYNDPKEFLFWD
jgi:hypothetical protein